ncbi:MAG: STAS domain-containing protein [Ignavibacteria bacterium]
MQYTKKQIEINSKPFVEIKILEQEVGFSNISELKELVSAEIASGNHNIAIDMNTVRVINSSGLGVLISILTKVNAVKGSFKLLNLNDKLKEIFQITRLDKVFDIDKI